MDERARRIGLNEALFREVNERVKSINDEFALADEEADFVCECGDEACIERIRVGLDDYERIRRDATLFVVMPGHELPEVEDVVEEHRSWIVVRKREGGPAELAEQTDPRS